MYEIFYLLMHLGALLHPPGRRISGKKSKKVLYRKKV